MDNQVIKKRSSRVKSGFSLIEVLITLLILSIGLASISILMLNNIKSLQDSNKQIIASMLAQEGIELVRNQVDNDPDPETNIPTGDRKIDEVTGALSAPGSDYLLYLNANKFYVHSSSGTTLTKFARKINVVVDTVNENITVRATVSWDGSSEPPLLANCTIANKCASFISVMPILD